MLVQTHSATAPLGGETSMLYAWMLLHLCARVSICGSSHHVVLPLGHCTLRTLVGIEDESGALTQSPYIGVFCRAGLAVEVLEDDVGHGQVRLRELAKKCLLGSLTGWSVQSVWLLDP